MNSNLQPADVNESGTLLDLAEEVRRSGVGRLIKRGDQVLAVLLPVTPPQQVRSRRPSRREAHDALLNIVGLGASAEPTDIARDEQEELAEAYVPARQ